jgi:hypothetical protein
LYFAFDCRSWFLPFMIGCVLMQPAKGQSQTVSNVSSGYSQQPVAVQMQPVFVQTPVLVQAQPMMVRKLCFVKNKFFSFRATHQTCVCHFNWQQNANAQGGWDMGSITPQVPPTIGALPPNWDQYQNPQGVRGADLKPTSLTRNLQLFFS